MNKTNPLLLLFLILLVSCGSDDASSDAPKNYDGNGSVAFSYQANPRPSKIELSIYDQEDNLIYSNQWDYFDYIALAEESDNLTVTLENIVAGPQKKMVILGKDMYGGVATRGEKTFDLEALSKPYLVQIIGEAFFPELLSPEDRVVVTQDTLKSFEWAAVYGAEKYKVTVYNTKREEIITEIVEDTIYSLTSFMQNIFASPSEVSAVTGVSPFPDTGQVLSYSDTGIIAFSGVDAYEGQDSQYTKNPMSYTIVEYYDGTTAFKYIDTPIGFLWDVIAIDAYDNESAASKPRSFSIIWRMVQDNVTGLTWEVKTKDDSAHDRDKLYTWQEANDFINKLNKENFGGYNDWRIPAAKELSSLIRCLRGPFPKIDSSYFLNTVAAPFRSSTRLVYYNAPYNTDLSVWHVDFSTGDLYERNSSLEPIRVRAVRGETIIPSYVDNEDGTVTDTATGLMWTKKIEGPMKWQQALAYCEGLSLVYDDWRLPNRNELHSLVDYGRRYPIDSAAIDPVFISGDDVGSKNLSAYYWTSTTSDSDPKNAFIVSFSDGGITSNNKTYTDDIMVRAVRYAQ